MMRIVGSLIAVLLITVVLLAWHTQEGRTAKNSPAESKRGDQLVAKLRGKRVHEIALAGHELTQQQAKALESRLQQKPDDVVIRTLLLGYYSSNQLDSSTAKAAHQGHVLFMIQHHPDAEIMGLPYAGLDPVLDKGAYEKGKNLWLTCAKTHSKNTAILGNAAQFFLIYDGDQAEKLLKQAQALEPKNPRWSQELAQLFALHAADPTESGPKSLAELEKALSQIKGDTERFYLLDEVAGAAFDAGHMVKATQYANELLSKAARYKNDWNYGNAIHHGNLILGRVALKSGDTAKAKECLIAAGKTPGSPQLDSFGPNMMLAKELIEKGEKDAVLEYFTRCGSFWEMGTDNLKQWTADVKAGKTPDFGANLDY